MPNRSASGAASQLDRYHAKRDFSRTPEPRGARAKSAEHAFVIQQHAARRMHYDFRLAAAGVLWSWSVPKGPSLDPKQRRLAVRTEDHPLEYIDFEGTIPAGEYGAGAMIVWDRGTWQPHGDAAAALAAGHLTFDLDGEKLHGRWHLVRTKPRGKQEQWLLFKGRDDAATTAVDIVATQPRSVKSGRAIDELAAETPRGDDGLAEIVARLGFPLTHLDKVLFEQPGLTKAQLITYLATVSERMLRHVAGRPVAVVRCPNGSGAPCFYQRHARRGAPPAIEALGRGDDRYMVVRDVAGLVALAQLGALELHTWNCHASALEQPDQLVFDLDPAPGVEWSRVAEGALELRRELAALDLTSFAKTTGGKGLHVVVPIRRGSSWDEVARFAKQIAQQLERAHPERYTAAMAKARRSDKIFVDYLRNARVATAVAPYSPRARRGAPVAMPVAWSEVERGVDPAAFTIETVPHLLAARRDPWRKLREVDQPLPRSGRR